MLPRSQRQRCRRPHLLGQQCFSGSCYVPPEVTVLESAMCYFLWLFALQSNWSIANRQCATSVSGNAELVIANLANRPGSLDIQKKE